MVLTLPPSDKHPVLLLRYSPNTPSKLLSFVQDRLKEAGLLVVTKSEERDGEPTVWGIGILQSFLEKQAEIIGLPKVVHSKGNGTETGTGKSSVPDVVVMESFVASCRHDFVLHPSATPTAKSGSTSLFPLSSFDDEELFTASDRARLAFTLWENLPILPIGKTSSNLSRCLDNGADDEERRKKRENRLMKSTLSGLKRHQLTGNIEAVNSDPVEPVELLCHALEKEGYLELATPAHHRPTASSLSCAALDPRTSFCTLFRGMRDYYGEEVAFYFAFADRYRCSLLLPGMSGLLIYAWRTFWTGKDVDNCRITPLHGFITFVWAITFLRSWEREEYRLAQEWGTYDVEKMKKTTFRSDFRGVPRICPITGESKPYFRKRLRFLRYIVSIIVTILLLCGTFWIMILSLNLQGLIRANNLWGSGKGGKDEWVHPFHYPLLSVYAEEGNLFDTLSTWRYLIPVLFHSIAISAMNAGYRRVAERLTKWENHETHIDYGNSLVLKRFLFEAFDAYIVLFYLAFYERDFQKLRAGLVTLFNVDVFRRTTVECILPFIQQKIGSNLSRSSGQVATKKKDDDAVVTDFDDGKHLLNESHRDEYDNFDDYIETIVQFGYITLFATAYPLAPLVALVANSIELRGDCWKLSNVCLRPKSVPSHCAGRTYTSLLATVVWMSAFTNCFIFAFTSRQMATWLPQYFVIDEGTGDHYPAQGKGWIVVATIFGIERVLLGLGLVIRLLMPSVPGTVKEIRGRIEYLKVLENQTLHRER